MGLAGPLARPVFRRSLRGQAFVNALMAATPTVVSKDLEMQVLDLGKATEMLVVGHSPVVVLRKMTREYWAKVVQEVLGVPDNGAARNAATSCSVVAVGSPGTGKSATAPYLLKLLLEKGKRVVFQIRGDDEMSIFYLFSPSSTGVSCSVTAHRSRRLDELEVLQDPDTVLVIEPRRYRFPPDDFGVKSTFVLICSPNEAHYKGLVKGNDHGKAHFFYYSLWSVEELLAARSFINPGLSEIDVKDRYNYFGGCARLVFDTDVDNLTRSLRMQTSDVASLSIENVVKYLIHGQGEVSDGESYGTISSKVAGYISKPPFSVMDRTIQLISQHVEQCVMRNHLRGLWNMTVNRTDVSGELGYGFERLALMLLGQPSLHFQVQRYGSTGAATEMSFSTTRRYTYRVGEPLAAVKSLRCPTPILIPASDQYPMVDAVDRGEDGSFRVFQCTVGKTHKAHTSTTHMDTIAEELGCTVTKKLRVYFLVPFGNVRQFKTDPVAWTYRKAEAYVVSIGPDSVREGGPSLAESPSFVPAVAAPSPSGAASASSAQSRRSSRKGANRRT